MNGNEGLGVIFEEIYAPCFRSSEKPCSACVKIGLEKAFRYGMQLGEKKEDEKVSALMALKCH